MSKKLRVIVLMHEDLVPPDSLAGLDEKSMQPWKSEYDVMQGLKALGHEARALGVSSDLGLIRDAIADFQPAVAFNMLEEFHGITVYDQHVVSYLELMRQPYTGCNPRGLMLAHDKALCKKILLYHRIPTPRFVVFPQGRVIKPPRGLSYPLLVKSLTEEASSGISQASVVRNDEKLRERVEFVHQQFKTDVIAEEYIEGRELYVSVMGNQRLNMFPIWEMVFANMPDNVPHIATAKVKWDYEYQKKRGITTQAAADLPAGCADRIFKLCSRLYRALSLSGYARMDLRLTPDGRIFVLEANPNPNLERGEDFAGSAKKAGIEYEDLLQRIMSLGMRYQAEWKALV